MCPSRKWPDDRGDPARRAFDALAHRPLRLRLYPDAVLREVAVPIDWFDQRLSELAGDMYQLMRRHRGIGLAAPQVGLDVRLFVADVGDGPFCVVNPRLVLLSDQCDNMVEGCLSLPDVQVDIRRRQRIEVIGRDTDGRLVHMEGTGLKARVIQHEVDHLDGLLICDYADATDVSSDMQEQRSNQ